MTVDNDNDNDNEGVRFADGFVLKTGHGARGSAALIGSACIEKEEVRNVLKYWLWLATRKGLGARGAYLVARHFPSPEAAFFADPKSYEAIEGLRAPGALLDKDLGEAEKILRACYDRGISIVTMQDAAYPQRLLALDDPPTVLYYKGTMPDLNGPAIGVVGTRNASLYGLTQARRMGYGLSRCGAVVISGGAKGIDTEALRGALLGGSPVVAVLGCGVDVVYPQSNRTLFRDIMDHGCLLSELPPGLQPRPEHFPVRNRIISGLSVGVLVVEAPLKSGALITAQRALDQGRDVFALPANVGQRTGDGNLQLLREGAILVRDPWELLQEYTGQFPHALQMQDCSGWDAGPAPEPENFEKTEKSVENSPSPVKKPVDKGENRNYIDAKKVTGLSPEEQQLTGLLAAGPCHIDTLSEQLGQPAGCVLALLTMLEVRGLIQHLPGRMFSLALAENQ